MDTLFCWWLVKLDMSDIKIKENKNTEAVITKNKISKLRWFLRRLKMALKILAVMFLLLIVISGVWFYKEYGSTIMAIKDEAQQLVLNADNSTFSRNRASTVYDINGNVIDVYTTGKKTGYITYDEIPEYAVQAMIATEDRGYFEHSGVDVKANIKAVYELIKNEGAIKRGASTITQQLAKNIFLSGEVTWQRKTEEIFIATALEEKYDKNEILEFYLNNIYFANGYYGIEAASQGYFSVSAKELDLSHVAFLCAIPNSPTRYDPLVNMQATLDRRDRVLEQMRDVGYISSSQYSEAIEESIVLNQSVDEKKNVSTYVTSYVNNCAVRAIMQSEGFDLGLANGTKEEQDEYLGFYDVCQRYIYSKGYNIYTSIDLSKQAKLQKIVNEKLKEFKDKKDDGVYNMQGAAVCIDNSTGKVTAIVGGRSQAASAYGINRAYQSFRQPGSCFKPILVYASAFEKGYTPDSEVVDEKIENGPENSNGTYLGKITIRSAIENSVNTVAWNLYGELDTHYCLSHLIKMNFKKISYEDDNLAASLGGVAYGVSPLEMAAAYAALENDGIYRNPTCIVKITDVYNNEIINFDGEKKAVYDVNAARMVTDCLKGVLVDGTAKGFALDNITCAGKTGTTNDKKDGWFVGYSPYYTTAVWVGADIPVSIENLKGNTYPLVIWHEFMEQIHKGLKDKEFAEYRVVLK